MTTKPLFLAALAALTLAAPLRAEQPAHGTGHAAHTPAAEAVKLGDLALSGGFTRATLPGAPVAGGFLTITNTGSSDDQLTGVSASFSGEGQIHEMKMEGDVMKMRELPEGLPIPAGATVELKPGGYHLMFMALSAPLVEGTTVEVTLGFAKAGQVVVPLSVLAPGAKSAAHSGHGG